MYTTRYGTATKVHVGAALHAGNVAPNIIVRRRSLSGVTLRAESDSLAMKKDEEESSSQRGRSKLSGFVEVSSYAEAIGFLIPVFMSRESWRAFVEVEDDIPLMTRNPRMKERRLLEILLQALRAARGAGGERTAHFDMYRLTSKEERKNAGMIAVCRRFLVGCGFGDQGEPIILIELAKSREKRD